ncbi:class III extradiol ring-cleavage dioxygenase [uncultured Methanomethylovorans sp.]|uniref:dioxygenase family protein n=1 Tax=uncultured Methanomethylovorans sp. TaxID=183759 RepID=UPI002AA8FD0D|nr:class III extradiol ring-cleavage dioxygenase [uncultured Methanomethylovorans sp.]
MKSELSKMPVLFVGHGSSENAIEDNEFTRGWKKIAELIPKPKAILCVSAHWKQPDTDVTAMEYPRTIHDFYGFPDELYRMDYRVKGPGSIAEKMAM